MSVFSVTGASGRSEAVLQSLLGMSCAAQVMVANKHHSFIRISCSRLVLATFKALLLVFNVAAVPSNSSSCRRHRPHHAHKAGWYKLPTTTYCADRQDCTESDRSHSNSLSIMANIATPWRTRQSYCSSRGIYFSALRGGGQGCCL
jgi:hypothetical protein